MTRALPLVACLLTLGVGGCASSSETSANEAAARVSPPSASAKRSPENVLSLVRKFCATERIDVSDIVEYRVRPSHSGDRAAWTVSLHRSGGNDEQSIRLMGSHLMLFRVDDSSGAVTRLPTY